MPRLEKEVLGGGKKASCLSQKRGGLHLTHCAPGKEEGLLSGKRRALALVFGLAALNLGILSVPRAVCHHL